MKRILLILLGVLAVGLLAIQFVPVARENPPVQTEIPVTAEVRAVLRESCYDCHSNEAIWPWYSRVAPVSWLVADDVRKGREELNFSTWNVYPPDVAAHKIEEIGEEVEEGKMPLPKYLRMHPAARLTAEDRRILNEWTHGN